MFRPNLFTRRVFNVLYLDQRVAGRAIDVEYGPGSGSFFGEKARVLLRDGAAEKCA